MDNEISKVVEFHQQFRASLFAASITMGSFLFTMKAFIIQQMKSGVYEQPEHQIKVTNYRKEQEGSKQTKLGYYDGLRNLGRFLLASIFLSFISALCQISIGMFDQTWSALTCLIVAGVAIGIVLWSVGLVSCNLSTLIKYAEEKAERQAVSAAKPETANSSAAKDSSGK